MTSELDISEEEALQAVRNRDAAYDGRFYFAVLTTGIYCRPSCSSRAAKVANLRFFSSVHRVESAGFRACKRCKPDKQAHGSTEENTMVMIARYIEQNSDERITLASLSDRFKLSSAHLQKSFKAVFGLSPREFHHGLRQHHFKALMRKGSSVTDALYSAGYGSSSRVYENADQQLGMTPGSYKVGGAGEAISYACAKTSMGFLMLAATDKGVCFAMFADKKSDLLALLKAEFPDATLSRSSGSAQLDTWFLAIEHYLLAKTKMPDIPLDLRGSAFQLRVWRFLQTIAEGSPVSYRDVAEGIKQPSAIRAAASACAKNRVALLVPCHRVLRADGKLGGYRWGLDVKRELLALEKEYACEL